MLLSKKVTISLLVLVFICVATLFDVTKSQSNANNNLFLTLWEEINKLVTPKLPIEGNVEPAELFLMNTPGTTINSEDYDDAIWKANGYQSSDPDLLKFELSDMIPAKAAYYVDSGQRLSTFYKIFLTNYISPEQQTTVSEESEEYKKAIEKLFNPDYSPSNLVLKVNATRDIIRETFSRVANIRDLCLKNEPSDVCSKKMLYYQSEVDDQNLIYIVTRKELIASQATVLSLQTRTLDNILTVGLQRFLSFLRSGVGGTTLLGSYLLTNYDPGDFYCWWGPGPCASESAAFSSVSIVSSSKSTKEASTYSRLAFGAQASLNAGLVKVSGGYSRSSSKDTFDASSEGEDITVAFDISQIRVYRQWFDPSLFEYSPLGVDNTPINSWSDGKYNGIAPWYITKIIVARNISISMSKFTSDMQSVLTASQSDASMSVGFGPFSASAKYSDSNTSANKATSFTFNGKSLNVKGPQIIGYVVSKIPAFPNYEVPPPVPTSNTTSTNTTS